VYIIGALLLLGLVGTSVLLLQLLLLLLLLLPRATSGLGCSRGLLRRRNKLSSLQPQPSQLLTFMLVVAVPLGAMDRKCVVGS